jgi:anti-anti-sigma factor
VIAAVIELVDIPALITLYRAFTSRLGREFGFVARPDFIAAIAALLGVTVFDTLPGLFIGISVSMLLLIYRASRPYVARLGREPGPHGRYSDVDRHPDNEMPPHVAVVRVESGLYFANADAIRGRILHVAEEDGITAIVIDAETVPFIDVTAARMLAALDQDLRRREVRLLIARDIGQVRDVLRNVIDDPALTHVYPSVQSAVDEASRRMVEAAR